MLNTKKIKINKITTKETNLQLRLGPHNYDLGHATQFLATSSELAILPTGSQWLQIGGAYNFLKKGKHVISQI